jgi:hypothetical protein
MKTVEYLSTTTPGRRYRLHEDGTVDRLDPGEGEWVEDRGRLHDDEDLVVVPRPAF